MAKAPNMKIGIGADTSDFEKGAKQVKQGLNDLSKTGNDALSSLGEAFGVNTGKVGQMVSAIQGLGQKMSQCGDAGVAAFGNILKSIGPVGTALAGLGISAAIAGFKALKDEADAFKQTVAGANMEMATAAYIDTYRQVLRDFRGDFGKTIAESESSIKKFFGTLGAQLKASFSTGAAWGTLVPGLQTQGLISYVRQTGEAQARANDAAYLTEKIAQNDFKRKQLAVDIAKINDQIADQMNIARDASKSIADRQQAIAQAEDLIAERKSKTVPLEKEQASLYEELSKLATNKKEEEEILLQQQARAYEISRQETQEATALLRIKNSIGKASEADLAASKKKTEELEKQKKLLDEYIKAARARGAEMTGIFDGAPTLSGIATGPQLSIRTDAYEFKNRIVAEMGEITLYVGLKADTQKIQDISSEINTLLQSGVSRTAEIIGNLVGTLAGGGNAWGDFKNAALSAFGDLAIAVGKIAIAAGVGSEGIKAALKLDNPYIAIAAGAALIALGTAVKSSLSAVASGDYSAAGGGYSSGYGSSSSGGDWETRDVQVNVNGTLKADGDQLIAVINSTNNKQYYTQ